MLASPAVRQLLITNDLRRLLVRAAAKSETSSLTSPLREVLREICKSSDFQTEKPEQLLIAFKLSLTEAANDANISPGPARTRLLDQVVTFFIAELFAVYESRRAVEAEARQIASGNSIPSRTLGSTEARP